MYEATVLKSLIEKTLRLRVARGIEGMTSPPMVGYETKAECSTPIQYPKYYPSYPYHHKSGSCKQALVPHLPHTSP